MHRKSRFTLVMMALLLMVGMLGIQPAKPVLAANPLRISQVYGGGGDSGATYTNDFIEIFNSSNSAFDLTGWSVQFTTSTGSIWQITPLTGTIPASGYYLIQEGAGGGGTTPLPTPDEIGSIYLVPSNFKVALVDSTTALSGTCPTGVVDFVGTGTAACFEGTAAAPNPSITLAIVRKEGGCTDTDNNSADFDALAPTPRNSASSTNSCGPAEIIPTELFFSEYIEGSSNNKALEIYNGTGAPVDLTDYKVELYSNGSTTPGNQLTLEGSLPSGDVYVIANEAANAAILAVADITSTVTYYNGDDALILRKISTNTVIDSIGQVGIDPGTKWGTEPVTTVEHTLTRKETICEGDSNGYDSFDPALEWDGYAQDDFTHIGSHVTNCLPPPEEAPEVLSTTPANNGSAQTTDDIIITFSEPVTVVAPWFSISCGTSGTHTAAVADADPIFTLNPDPDFVVGETCTVTIDHTKVYDDDNIDEEIANYMLADYTFSFTVVPGCGDAYTPIYEIQGTGETSPLVNQNVTTEGVVVGDFQVTSDLGGKAGYYIQEPDADADPLTSNGIFVYNTTTAVNVGDRVRVQGKAVEYYGITEISPVTQVLICSTGNTITPTPVILPVDAVSDFEKYESMLVTFPQALVISEYFNFDRYGEIVLTSERHMTPTAFVEPGPDAVAAAQDYLVDRITLDDGRTNQNPDPAIHPNGLTFDMTNLFRGGGTVTGVTGVLDYSYDLYRIHPTTGATYENTNLRTTAPDITEADLKIASFNVLNYFVTLTSEGSICGPAGNQECRGADTAEEFARQKAKILAAMAIIDADVFGLMEIENDSPVSGKNAVADLVAGLNAIEGVGPYDYIETGAIGTDVIKLAILYKPASVTPVGEFQILDSTVDPRFLDTRNRPALAQVFMDNVTGDEFVVAVNHLKSKGSDCDDLGDFDMGDGQGNCNLTRLAAAQALVDWLADNSKFPDAEKKLIIGDLNSYDKEDPIDAIKLGADDIADTDDDYLDMIFDKRGEYAYGYVFDGQTGYLDHALANQIMADSIVDVNIWHINADEPDLIDYDMSFKAPAQDALYAPDAYRSSDHDPVIITLNMNAAPVAEDQEVTTAEDTPIDITLVATDPEGDPLEYSIVDLPSYGEVVLVGNVATYTPDPDYIGTDSFTFKVNDGMADSDLAVVTITVTPVNDWVVANDDEYETMVDVTLEISAPGVLTNDELLDPNETVTLEVLVQPASGTLTLNDDGSFTYVPNAGFFGVDTFVYQLNSTLPTMLQGEFSDTAIVTINVTPRQIFLPLILR